MLESLGAAREAVDLDGDQFGARKWVRDRRGLSFATEEFWFCTGAHKWYAIALSITSAYDGARASRRAVLGDEWLRL